MVRKHKTAFNPTLGDQIWLPEKDSAQAEAWKVSIEVSVEYNMSKTQNGYYPWTFIYTDFYYLISQIYYQEFPFFFHFAHLKIHHLI